MIDITSVLYSAMNPNFFLLAVAFFLLGSCDKKTCEPDTRSSTFSANKAIHVSFDTSLQENLYTIKDGDELVFQRVYSSGHCEGSADDTYTLTLGFELPSNSTHFTLKDSALVIAHCFAHHISTWIYEYYPVTFGTIEGEKHEDDEWSVGGTVTYTIPLSYTQVQTISFAEVFRQ